MFELSIVIVFFWISMFQYSGIVSFSHKLFSDPYPCLLKSQYRLFHAISHNFIFHERANSSAGKRELQYHVLDCVGKTNRHCFLPFQFCFDFKSLKFFLKIILSIYPYNENTIYIEILKPDIVRRIKLLK